MTFKKLILLFSFGLFFFGSVLASNKKSYTKQYDHNGKIIAEGWSMGTIKTGYWTFYYHNGQVSSKGHFRKNKKEGYWYFFSEEGKIEKEGHYHVDQANDWWIFYDIANHEMSKFQYQNNKKNGYALRYKKKKLTRAEKYENNIRVGSWNSIWAFKRDNPTISF